MRQVHDVCDEYGDVATTSLLEVWIDETERRTWFLYEASRRPPGSNSRATAGFANPCESKRRHRTKMVCPSSSKPCLGEHSRILLTRSDLNSWAVSKPPARL